MSGAAIDSLRLAIEGDLAAFERLLRVPHEEVVRASRGLELPVLTRGAVARVLRDLHAGAATTGQARTWAVLVWLGLLPTARPSAEAIPVEWDPSADAELAEAISKLEQLGDTLDGDLSRPKLGALIQAMEK